MPPAYLTVWKSSLLDGVEVGDSQAHRLISTQVMKVTWDSVDYLNENAEQPPEPEGGPAPGKPKAATVRRKKRRKKKSTSKKGDL